MEVHIAMSGFTAEYAEYAEKKSLDLTQRTQRPLRLIKNWRLQMVMMIAIALSLVLAPVLLAAQEQSAQPRVATIQVEGNSVVHAKPDRAEVELGVVTQAPDAKTAATQNAQKLDRVIQQLRSQVGQNLEIKTIGYSLSPNYVYPPQGGEPKITGYIASNIVQVRTDDLVQTGTIIDTAIKAGANNVQALRFLLKDEASVQTQALKEAAAKARTKADALAASLNVKIVRVLNVVEGGETVVPMYTRQMAGMEAAKMDVSTPVEPGTLEIHGKVTLTVEIQ